MCGSLVTWIGGVRRHPGSTEGPYATSATGARAGVRANMRVQIAVHRRQRTLKPMSEGIENLEGRLIELVGCVAHTYCAVDGALQPEQERHVRARVGARERGVRHGRSVHDVERVAQGFVESGRACFRRGGRRAGRPSPRAGS